MIAGSRICTSSLEAHSRHSALIIGVTSGPSQTRGPLSASSLRAHDARRDATHHVLHEDHGCPAACAGSRVTVASCAVHQAAASGAGTRCAYAACNGEGGAGQEETLEGECPEGLRRLVPAAPPRGPDQRECLGPGVGAPVRLRVFPGPGYQPHRRPPRSRPLRCPAAPVGAELRSVPVSASPARSPRFDSSVCAGDPCSSWTPGIPVGRLRLDRACSANN